MGLLNAVTLADRLTKSISGVKKHYPNGLTLGGVTYTEADLEKLFQAYIMAAAAVLIAKAAWRDKVAEARAARGKVVPVHRKLLTYVATVMANGQQVLADFGTAPVTRKTPKPAVKAAAAQKSLATRKERKTMGKVQKKALKGTVPAPATSTTAPAPVAPATPPATR